MELLKPPNAIITSLVKALDEIDENWRNYNGIIIPGSWPGEDDKNFVQTLIPKTREAKDTGVPFLGICLGLHAIALMEGGEVEEMETQRQGIYPVKGWWGETYESHWHRFKVKGVFTEYDTSYTDGVLEVMKLLEHLFFVGVQFHPEYESTKKEPHPVLKEFIKACSVVGHQASEN